MIGEPNTPEQRLELLRDLTDNERHSVLAWLSGYAPKAFDQGVALILKERQP